MTTPTRATVFDDFQEEVYDDRTGEVLDARLTMNAENEKMACMERPGVGIESTEDECWARTEELP